MKIDKLILGDFKTNCYVVSHENTCFIIDPACDGETIYNFLLSREYDLKAIFLTHGHPDHIGAVDYLVNKYNCSVRAHINDRALIQGAVSLNLPSLKGIRVNSRVDYFDGDFNSFSIDGIILDAIATPGHTAGGVTYVLRNYKRIFSGDTIMKNSIGRLDLPGANKDDMRNSINLFKSFSADCKVHPGHGESTTIAFEKANSRYFLV